MEEFAKALSAPGALLGLDLGTKTIGLSVSDVTRSFAVPLKTIERTRLAKDIDALRKIIADREIKGLVLGLPINMDGSEGPRAQSTRTFASNLAKEITLPLVFWDERLSTFEAGQIMIEADVSRKKRAEKIDAAAATVILQGALDSLKAQSTPHLASPLSGGRNTSVHPSVPSPRKGEG
jgi:putative Holliday junction resolvase